MRNGIIASVNITSKKRPGYACQSANSAGFISFTDGDRARFWAKVCHGAPNECWTWQASLISDGYGQFMVTVAPKKQRTLYAHRVAWELTYGPIPAGTSVLHKCDVPRCVNPAHLFLGTQTDNMRDASSKGHLAIARRRTRGVKPVVVTRYLNGGVTAEALAAEYGIAKLTVLRWVHERVGDQDLRPGRSGNSAPTRQRQEAS